MDTQALLMAQIVQASELAKAAQAAGEFGPAAATVGALVVMTGQLLDLTKAPSGLTAQVAVLDKRTPERERHISQVGMDWMAAEPETDPVGWTAWEARLDDHSRRLVALESTDTLE